jgi:KDO2-lipid IV(A) lauroyltransferase
MSPSRSLTLYHPRYWPTWLGVALLWSVTQLPLPVIWILGNALGPLIPIVSPLLRRTARTNIRMCFPGMSERDLRKLTSRHFRMLGVSMLTYGLGWWLPPDRLKRLVRFEGRQHYDDALAAGRNIILFTPHFLALDVSGITLSSERPMMTMYREARDKVVDHFLKKRGRFGALLFERKANLKALIRHLREGRPFYYLPDQDPGGADAVFVPFFGVPTATITAFSRIAKMTDSVVIPCYNRILPWGRGFEVRFEPPLADYPSDDAEADARRMNEAIENVVRQYPDQYLWSYRRFKTRPPGERPVYR